VRSHRTGGRSTSLPTRPSLNKCAMTTSTSW
jgi:hypothetical protein